ncbi:HNH endonuclease signature motif containing protein [Nesterenkonia ebinurensis]|uniref:HNH endonuclease signature motif containing protein n=1 Tax=Nesterenkonia ebinurensis TaxID=2608252 RepID=UPI00123DB74D|nr:HNH endonuclease signature motif containing protein [Nesterenkonia ebinurensis]
MSANPALLEASATTDQPRVLPEGYESLAAQPELAAAWEAETASRQAEAQKITHLLEYRDRRLAEDEQRLQHTFTREAALKAIHHQAAVLLGVTDHEVRRMLSTASTAREWLPHVWETYCTGQIDFLRVQKIAAGAGDLIETCSGHPEAQRGLTAELDAHFAPVAPGENKNTLAQQIRDFVAHQDPEGHQRRYERAKNHRRVDIIHHDNGLSTLRAVLPTMTLAPLEQDLHAAAKTMPRKQKLATGTYTGEEDVKVSERSGTEEASYPNRMADILTAWLEAGSTGETSCAEGAIPVRVGATINITVPLDTLTGASEAPAVASDGRFTIPAAEARRIATDPAAKNTYYLTGTTANPGGAQRAERIVKVGKKNPLTGLTEGTEAHASATSELAEQILALPNLLETSSTARFVTGNLRTGILLRDKQCQAHGCTEPGFRAEVDHKTSHETGGATDAENSWVLCHTHHELKGHGLLPEAGPDPPGQMAQPAPDAGSHSLGQTSPDPPPAWATADATCSDAA